jgi:hypothetical protein
MGFYNDCNSLYLTIYYYVYCPTKSNKKLLGFALARQSPGLNIFVTLIMIYEIYTNVDFV